MTMWGIHNDALGAELVEGGFVSIGWDRAGDIRKLGTDQVTIREALQPIFPEGKPGAFPVWAGVLRRFAYEMTPGDVVISPNKASRTLNFGVVEGPYEYHPEVPAHRNRRRVRWIKTGVSRSLFPTEALYEIGSAVTLFQVKKHEPVFRAYLEAQTDEDFTKVAGQVETAVEAVDPLDAETLKPQTASDLEQVTQDEITDLLLNRITHEEFEHFTADLLRTVGYQARVTQYVSDGGVDVIAHRDPLGLEPPIIKVQCKHTSVTQGRPEVQKLLGTLATGELGLFVCLGTYSQEAFGVERSRRDLRLLGGADITRLILDHYSDLPRRWRDLVPLRQVWVIDREAETGKP